MKAAFKLTLPALVAGAMIVAINLADAQQRPFQRRLVGTWTLVSGVTYQGETTSAPLGSRPLGTLMLDQSRRFMLMMARRDLPKFTANKRDAGTPEENKALLAGLLALMGTYRVQDAGQSLVLHIEAGTFPNWVGTDQRCPFTLVGDQMIWLHTMVVGGQVAQVVWRHVP